MVDMLVLALTWVDVVCWIVCFWWMHRISSRQNATLEELHQVTRRIEQVARSEHDLIQDVHVRLLVNEEILTRFDPARGTLQAYLAGVAGRTTKRHLQSDRRSSRA